MHRRWMAGLSIRTRSASHRAGRLHRGRRGGDGAAGSSGSPYRSGAAGLVAGPGGEALQALRGMALVAAATVMAELGDITRFANPRQLMAYLGLVPSEHSSGATRRQGGITKAGNGAARRMLIEAAWSYRFPARISREQLLRQESLASRSATPPGRPRSDCVGDIASSPGRENRPPWSPPRSLENWRALSGRSPNSSGRRTV